jgi:hypothetical protein
MDSESWPADLERMQICVGGGKVNHSGKTVRLEIGPTAQVAEQKSDQRAAVTIPYCNAQLDDYHRDGQMRRRAPLRLALRARFSHTGEMLMGTAGFGMWNDPLGMTGRKRLRLPQTAWFFFASRPSNLAFALDVPGHGLKAATLDAATPLSLILLPFAPLAFLALRWQWLYRQIWPLAQRLWRIDERPATLDMRQWHDYELVWTEQEVRWSVDGQLLFCTSRTPKGPLGLVIWIDNQMMVATPEGHFAHGTVATGQQWLEIARLEVDTL